MAELTMCGAALDVAAERHEWAALLCRISRSKPPSAEGRATLRRGLTREPKLRCVHVAVEDQGFIAATPCAALSALARVGMRQTPLVMHTSDLEARAAFERDTSLSAALAAQLDAFLTARSDRGVP